MSKILVEEFVHERFGKCVRIANGIVDAVCTVDFGPRIIRYGFLDMENELSDSIPWTLEVGDNEWRYIGGHRIWSGPESFPRTYIPDNDPVKWEKIEGGIRLSQDMQPWTQIKKEIDIVLSEDDSILILNHKLTNKNAWTIEFCGWAITMMACGGTEIIPQNRPSSHFTDGSKYARSITLWPYSAMDDSRVHWGSKYILLKHDANNTDHIKFGISNTEGWGAYYNKRNLFIIKYNHEIGAKYADLGVSFETFANEMTLELETKTPMIFVEPNDALCHVEEWRLFKDIDIDIENEKDIEEKIKICLE